MHGATLGLGASASADAVNRLWRLLGFCRAAGVVSSSCRHPPPCPPGHPC